MNRVFLIGRLTRDPEIRQGQDGKAIAKFTVAVDRWNGKEADFVSCTAFGTTADLIEKYIRKGTKILVEGRLNTGTYTNKEGNKVYFMDVIVDRTEFVEPKKAAESAAAPSASDEFMQIPDDAGELPFE